MARLFTSSFESSDFTTEGLTSFGSPTFIATAPYLGAVAMSIATGAERWCQRAETGTLDRTYYVRAAFRKGVGTAVADTHLMRAFGTGTGISIRFNSATSIHPYNVGGSGIGGTQVTIADALWYVVEVRFVFPTAGDGAWAWRVNGVDISSGTATLGNAALASIRWGTSASLGCALDVDALAVNDDQGTSDSSWIGLEPPLHVDLTHFPKHNLRTVA